MKICFGDKEPELISYSDSHLTGDIDGRKSSSAIQGGVVWQSRLQKVCG
jgi:hypothetical protein